MTSGWGLLMGATVAVTGAAMGIGAGIAEVCVRQGAAGVLLVDRDSDALHETAGSLATIERNNADRALVSALVLDVCEPNAGTRIVERAVAELGGLTCAVNNAGTRGANVNVAECTDADWAAVLDLNLNSLFRCLRAEMAYMQQQGRGSIVNIGSASTLGTWPGMAPYISSKNGVIGLSKAASKEGAPHGVRVNVVHPGIIETPLMKIWRAENNFSLESLVERVPLGRLGTPQDIGNAVAWLCSDMASFVTGAALPVEGGRTG